MYLKKVFYDDPLFRDVKIVLSISDDKFEGSLASDFKQKLESEGIMDSNMTILEDPSYQNLYRFVMEYADGVIATSPDADASLLEYARANGKKVLEYQDVEDSVKFDNYKKFYDEL